MNDLVTLKYGDKLNFTYKNWKGEVSERNAIFLWLMLGSNEFHKEQQLLIEGYDMDKKVIRTFAVKDMSNVVLLEDME